MNQIPGLNGLDMEHLLAMIETSLRITKRSQFFLWSQGALQGFIAHETLLCAYGDVGRMRLRWESFSRGLPDAQSERELVDPVNGLMPRVVDDWLRAGRTPQLMAQGSPGPGGRQKILADLKRCSLGHTVAHGAGEVQGEHGSFFVFLRLPEPPTARDAYLLELLMPYLHMALYRMLAGERAGRSGPGMTKPLLSKREIQVLQWVKDGKTNQEIGLILGISPPTVKNHVQKILRKLKVSNRAQAVGKVDALRLFASADGY